MRSEIEPIQRHRLRNWLQMLLIVTGLALLLAVPVWFIAGTAGVVWTLALVAMAVYLGGNVPARVVLARSGAGLLSRGQAPGLYRILEELYQRAGIRAEPVLFYVPHGGLNAFAVGDDKDGGIAVTDGLLHTLGPRELAGVLAHEVSHLLHNDTRVMAMAAVMTQLTIMGATLLQLFLILMLPWMISDRWQLAWLILLFVALAPTLSTLLHLALSRNREFIADLEAVALTGDAYGLASALKVLERYNSSWLESLFGREAVRLPTWFQSHPPTWVRIQSLLALSHAKTSPSTWRPAMPQPPSVSPAILERPASLGRRYWIRRRPYRMG